MMRRTCLRLALRRGFPAQAMESAFPVGVMKETTKAGTIQPGSDAPPGLTGETRKPPETIGETMSSVREVFTPSNYSDLKEGMGYFGQKHSTQFVSRYHYGPGRYDYGRPPAPKTWFANYFYPFWEFGHICLVSDKWISIRFTRHILFTFIFFLPYYHKSYCNKRDFDAWKAAKGA
eukprot:gnl/TRDRNA2_/TRDRNA2_177446_c12_seq1.p1 gnl/TRDRNA2_/TRDRNA2_177446_c12~~gnl/TRDRNA2_/TRDRNA2_177446_c12_seq1.p1  ORF type:complete len:176 (+),score=35.87 gnl/TRDRNA2_/TRDRNA2_177446_c12_seq1:76-603(+)